MESEPNADGTGPLAVVGPPMNLFWMVGGVGVLLAFIVIARSWPRRSSAQDLGAVSHQWITEHRLGHGNDSRR